MKTSTSLSRELDDTLELTERLGSGDISPEAYVRARVEVVGESNLIESIIVPAWRAVVKRLTGTRSGSSPANESTS